MHPKLAGLLVLFLMMAGIAADAASSGLSERAISDFVAKAGVDHIWHTEQLPFPDNEWYISSYAIPHQLTPDICSTQVVKFSATQRGGKVHLYGTQKDLAVAFKSCADASPTDFHDVMGGKLTEADFVKLYTMMDSIIRTGEVGNSTTVLDFASEDEKKTTRDLSLHDLAGIEARTDYEASFQFVVKPPHAEILIFQFVYAHGKIAFVNVTQQDIDILDTVR